MGRFFSDGEHLINLDHVIKAELVAGATSPPELRDTEPHIRLRPSEAYIRLREGESVVLYGPAADDFFRQFGVARVPAS